MIGKIAGAMLGRKLADVIMAHRPPRRSPRSGDRPPRLRAIGLAVGGAWVAKKLWDRRNRARTSPTTTL